MLSGIVHGLRSAREAAGLSQNATATNLPVRGRAVSEWETEVIMPRLDHLVLWADELELRLVIRDCGVELGVSLARRPGETWVHYERRRLVLPMRLRRVAWGMTQGEVGGRIGVSRDSIQRWECADVPTRPIALVVWAREMGFRVGLCAAGRPGAASRLRRLRYGAGVANVRRDDQVV